MKDFSGNWSIIILAFIEVFTIAVGLFGTNVSGNIIFLSFTTIAIAFITFFGLLHIGMQEKQSSSITDKDMRTAITASIIVTYLTMTGMAAFFGNNAVKELPPLTQLLLTNFTTVVSIVIAFYFGSTAYLDKKNREKPTDLPNNTQPLSK